MNHTIAAIATPLGNAGIGVIRVSGSESYQIASKLFPTKELADYAPRTFHFLKIPGVDDVVVLLFKAPHSYTGEDVVEIQCHGGSYLCQKILGLVLEAGAKLAQPGEFTKRAFLNGRMDLSQAEAVMDLIDAKNTYAARSAIDQLEGSVSGKISGIRAKILHHTAYIEAALDDPEHISLDGYAETLEAAVEEMLEQIEALLKTSDNGRILKEGICTVIVGKPNVGKSTLLNALLGKERAIVTDIPGTTRDSLEEQILLDGVQLNLVDTAGIHDSEDKVEQIGIDRSRKSAGEADLVLLCLDASTDLSEEDLEILRDLRHKKGIILLNKTDLETVITPEQIMPENAGNWPILDISAKDRAGLDRLSALIKEMFLANDISYNDEVVMTSIRHKELLEETKRSLREVRNSIRMQLPEDFYSIDLMDAYKALGRITGETADEDLINEIFSKFCLGK